MPSAAQRQLLLTAQLLREQYAVVVVLHGNSMWPALRSGQRIRISPWQAAARDLRGKMVAFALDSDRIVVHRVVRTEGDMLITQGDAVEKTRERIPLSSVLGVAAPAQRPTRRQRLSALALRTGITKWPVFKKIRHSYKRK